VEDLALRATSKAQCGFLGLAIRTHVTTAKFINNAGCEICLSRSSNRIIGGMM
jgi:hypothetical protein